MSESAGYQVLARKYRPATFADLIGQEAMVRTLKNAFDAGRIAHAFVLTGVRGVGKTTTARIVAKGLNCIGPDGTGGPTTEPCGECEHCRAIAEGRHVDVMEMDAASRTGVGDIREIIDSVHYRAASARYKVYVIDEVHMLSTSAFNALLKTLEEPPAHVKFIFATTEIRKVPVTVLSRCQRFDLRRIEPETMIAHLADIAGRENARIAPDALALIARAAEGSMRDAMSLMDQAIAHGAGETQADQVRAMLGLADRGRVLDLFDLILRGDAAGALSELGTQYADGADPMAVLRDLAEITHWISVIHITPEAADDPTVSPDERDRGRQLAQTVPMRVLTRMWQMLLKALEEVGSAPNAMMAAEMAVIRMTHVADLPDPEKLLRRIHEGAPGAAAAGFHAGNGAGNGSGNGAGAPRAQLPSWRAGAGGMLVAATAPAESPDAGLGQYATFDDVVGLIRRMRDMKLLLNVESHVRLVRYAPGRIEFEPGPDAPADLAATLGARLQGWTGARWGISVTNGGGAPTIAETRAAERAANEAAALENPVVQAVFATFPEARFAAITPHQPPEALETLEAVDDDWDPFEDN
ncbi:DNA polymerase III subunit gamma/tau [Phaeovulum vinaykumarii]|uniref:DNA polymerase III subunit gamma/tau n=1 Tax=Phaeovulum vinaykumarii TaxID=407234 RepID=A0A1N7M9T4_9RHOB|nr:DNA polymerase III subunit gamma/tau [Phaeovulum vinaykumarii]SIS82875.1 DNA polymerase-3 subunit gamma/tau [Phaeovulum vinaykumarii]SOC10590.1 DNA polymerase-3 subunit gamma/tau [Phaeovulum vinaykumarii]